MTWVKICGMTNLEDALIAVEAGADAVGFVFYEKSPRNVSVEAAREIVEKLPESVEKIGVFVSGGELDPRDVLLEAGLTGTQTYMYFESGGRRDAGSARRTYLLPKRARFLMALPMKFIWRRRRTFTRRVRIRKLRQDLPEGFSTPEGLMDTFLLDSGDLRTPAERERHLIGKRPCRSQKRCGEAA